MAISKGFVWCMEKGAWRCEKQSEAEKHKTLRKGLERNRENIAKRMIELEQYRWIALVGKSPDARDRR